LGVESAQYLKAVVFQKFFKRFEAPELYVHPVFQRGVLHVPPVDDADDEVFQVAMIRAED